MNTKLTIHQTFINNNNSSNDDDDNITMLLFPSTLLSSTGLSTLIQTGYVLNWRLIVRLTINKLIIENFKSNFDQGRITKKTLVDNCSVQLTYRQQTIMISFASKPLNVLSLHQTNVILFMLQLANCVSLQES